MANRSHLSILKRGPRAWNRWRTKYPDITPELRWANLRNANLWGSDLRGADLRGADLERANISEADLSSAALKGADLTGANLVQTRLTGANLSGANLNGANLCGAILENTDLTGANLFRAILDDANLVGADLSETEVGYTKFSNVDLSAARGLGTLKHFAPSSVGIDTICISERKIPANFLRGAGVPQKLIDCMQCIEDKTFQSHSCFISYSLKDQTFAEKLRASLEGNGMKCWLAPETLSSGERIHAQPDGARKDHYKVLLVISEHSIASPWVEEQLERTRQYEIKESRRCLFPVRLVSLDGAGKGEKANGDSETHKELKEYCIQDFSDWENSDSYRKAFERLLAHMIDCDWKESPANSDSSACVTQLE